VTIGPHAVIDKGVTIGTGSTIGAGCYIGPYSSIGIDCQIHPHVTIRERCILGNRVILQPGVVIGGCGFGYLLDASGHHKKLNQLGTVILEDDVEIGSNSTIDRARFKETRISRGSKIDNLVQIGHGVIIGEDNIIIAQTGIAGSSKTGRHVVLAGHVAIAGHLTIADGVTIAGMSGITHSIQEAGRYGGIPAVPLSQYNRNAVHLRNIDKVIATLEQLKKRLSQLEETAGNV
jgi:UDP-3-O-[3-hydroxymyristoyl] glucosamine N-acyltransferase